MKQEGLFGTNGNTEKDLGGGAAQSTKAMFETTFSPYNLSCYDTKSCSLIKRKTPQVLTHCKSEDSKIDTEGREDRCQRRGWEVGTENKTASSYRKHAKPPPC